MRIGHMAVIRAVIPWLLALSGLAPVQADERILNFHADITVHENGELSVEETITVRAEGRQIRRGIYRDLIWRHHTAWGGRDLRDYQVVSVLRDGREEGWHRELRSRDLRIYMGRRAVVLEPGVYTYTLRYRARWQVRSFSDHDELYWNINGAGWNFVIDKMSARVHLPGDVPYDRITIEGYSGTTDPQYPGYRTRILREGGAEIRSTRDYPPGESLTFALTWPPGYVDLPSAAERRKKLMNDNQESVYALGTLLVLALYFLVVWSRVGKDPQRGPLVPQYEPDPAYSPASMRFVRNMRHDNKAMAAALVNLAAQGHIEISETQQYGWGPVEYTLQRKDPRPDDMAPGELALYRGLLGSRKKLTLGRAQAEVIQKARKKHAQSLRRNYEKVYFRNNYPWTLAGVVLFLAGMVPAVLTLQRQNAESIAAVLFALFWIAIMGTILYRLGGQAISHWRSSRKGIMNFVHAVLSTLIIIPFAAAAVGGIAPAALLVSASFSAIVLACLLLMVGFYHWMKAPTLRGRQLLDHVEGFREYLLLAEADELRLKNPPEKTPELFQRFLPYAIALDVEEAWGAAFADALTIEKPNSYQPNWFHGSNFDVQAFGSSLGSGITSSVGISTSSGGSSGSGGGGSSGGGGGGGGGGGW